eukprot:767617-Hanusia_phi.AAC.1
MPGRTVQPCAGGLPQKLPNFREGRARLAAGPGDVDAVTAETETVTSAGARLPSGSLTVTVSTVSVSVINQAGGPPESAPTRRTGATPVTGYRTAPVPPVPGEAHAARSE